MELYKEVGWINQGLIRDDLEKMDDLEVLKIL